MTYANVMATVAVFIALGGTSVAAISVTGKDVRNSSLTGRDVKNSSLTGRDMKNGSLLGADFAPGQLPSGAQGPPGVAGDRGAQGLQGPAGDDGQAGADGQDGVDGQPGQSVTSAAESPGANCANGGSRFTSASGTTFACHGQPGSNAATNVAHRIGNAQNVAAGGTITVSAFCIQGEKVTGGGGSADPSTGLFISMSYPEVNGWSVTYQNTSAVQSAVRARVVCVSP